MPAYDLRIRPHIKAEPTLEPVDDMPIEYMDEDEKKLTKRQRLLVWNLERSQRSHTYIF
jgi:hypothetical protein